MKSKYLFTLVTLGNPNAQCANYGICTTEVIEPGEWEEYTPPVAGKIKAMLMAESNERMLLQFDRSAVLPATWTIYFSTGFFKIETPYSFPLETAKALGYQYFTLGPGLIPLVFDHLENKVTLVFTNYFLAGQIQPNQKRTSTLVFP